MPRMLLLVAALVLAVPVAAADPPGRTHDIVMDDYFSLSFATGCAASPSGNQVAYTEMRWQDDEDASRNTDLWVVNTRTLARTRLTFDPASDSSPQWSPDERWIYFRTKRTRDDGDTPPYNGEYQVWRVSPQGGELFPVTRETASVSSFQVARDGGTLYYTVEKKQYDEDDWRDLREEFDDLEYGHGVHDRTKLFALDLESWHTTTVVDEGRYIQSFAVTDDESRIGMITRPDPTLITNEGWSTVDVYHAATNSVSTLDDTLWREEAPSPYGWIIGPTWSGDGQVLAFRVDFDGYPGEVYFAHFDAGDPPLIQQMDRPGEVHVEGDMHFVPGTRDFAFAADDHARTRINVVRAIRDGRQGKSHVLTPGDVAIDVFSFSGDGRLVVIRPGLDHNPDLFLSKSRGSREFTRLTNLNPQVDGWKLPQREIVTWTADDGTVVEGILELPSDYRPGDGALPLVVTIHGGPTSMSYYGFKFWIYGRTWFPARGWAVFDPNYRGSTGYGDTFLTDLVGRKNDVDVSDILSGVDALIERGIADPDRMAVMGWSNGGYLTNCIIAADQRFKAASSGAGVFDTVMQWSIEDTPGHVINFNNGLPWETGEGMHRSSPLYNADKITTPTVIHVGENDARVPAEHSRAMHRALHYYVKTPVELVVYPGTGHGLVKKSHRRAKLSWDTQWFDTHVLDNKPAKPALPGSE